MLIFASCKKTGDCYISSDRIGKEKITSNPNQPVDIHYFFKRNLSMAGYAIEGKTTEYKKALRLIYQTGDNIQGNNSFFYEYGVSSIDKLPDSSFIETRMIPNKGFGDKKSYYNGRGASGERRVEEVKQNTNDRPFHMVSEYIFKDLIKEGNGNKCLYIIVSNLLEQSNNTAVFSSFYDQAFKKGLSGAFLAVDSAFKGDVYNFSIGKTDGEEQPFYTIRDDSGRATFFILIAGSRNEVALYTNEFSQGLKRDIGEDNVYTSVFLLNPNETRVWTAEFEPGKKSITDTTGKKFRDNKYKYYMVNMDLKSNRELKLFKKEEAPVKEETSDTNRKPAKKEEAGVTAYRLKKDNSRYFAGLQVDSRIDSQVNRGDPGYKYSDDLFIEYYDTLSKTSEKQFEEMKDLSVFTRAITYKNNFPADLPEVYKKDYHVLISLETANDQLQNGFVYHVKYNIIPVPIIPQWIQERDTRELARYENTVMVVNLENVYKGIINAYNNAENREKYTVDFYLVR